MIINRDEPVAQRAGTRHAIRARRKADLKGGDMNGTKDTELDQLIDRFGPADEIRMLTGRLAAWSWTIDESGDGIGFARSATGARLHRQAEALLRVRYGNGLRKLVVAPRVCGNRRFHERPDLLEVEHAIGEGWCRWVAVTEFDRISRTTEAGELFASYLRETNTELVVANIALDQPFDLDRSSLDIHALSASVEAERLRRAAGRGVYVQRADHANRDR
jgi:hypothetical protein